MRAQTPILFLLLLLPLTGSQPIEPPSLSTRVQKLRRLQCMLSDARFAETCPPHRRASRDAITRAITVASACRRNDQPPQVFELYLRRCQLGNREQLEQLCARLGACVALREIRRACAIIGRTRATRRYCARKSPLRAYLASLLATRCPDRAPDFAQIGALSARVGAVADDIRVEARLPLPVYGVQIVDPLRGAANNLVVLLHDRGEAASVWDGLIDLARATGLDRTRFIAVRAPRRFVQELDVEVTTWFDESNVNQVVRAAGNIADILNLHNVVHGIPFNRMAVFGNGQGGALALTVYLRHRVAAVVANRAFVPILETYPADVTGASRSAPCLMHHGTADSVVPIERARRGARAMREFGRNVSLVEFEGEQHALAKSDGFVVEQSLVFLKRNVGV